LEKQSEHPLADAVVKYFDNRPISPISSFESITGKGAKAIYEGQTYYAGNKKLLAEHNIQIGSSLQSHAERWSKQSKTVIRFANSTEAHGVLAIRAKIKDASAEAILQLQDMGLEWHRLPGDSEATVKASAPRTGIKHYKAEVLPQDKPDL